MTSILRQEVQERENKVWQLRTEQKMTIYQIAGELTIDPTTVSKMLKRIGERAYKEIAARIEAEKSEQSFMLDSVISDAFKAFERSQEDAVTEKTRQKSVAAKPAGKDSKRKDGGRFGSGDDDYNAEPVGAYLDENGDDVDSETRADMIARHALEVADGDTVKAAQIVELVTAEDRKRQIGDPRYLNVILSALSAKRELWGLNAPKASADMVPVVVKVYQGGVDLRDLVQAKPEMLTITSDDAEILEGTGH